MEKKEVVRGNCAVDSCQKQAQVKGVCRDCYQLICIGYLKVPQSVKKEFAHLKKCPVPGCTLNAFPYEHCKAHQDDFEMDRPFRQIKRKKPEENKKQKERNKGKQCKFPGCDRDATSLGYCPAHYDQLRKGKGLRPLKTTPKNGGRYKKEAPSFV